jgi:hypothetical protein
MGLTHAILSSWWSYEDHGHGWEGGVMLAEIVAEMLYNKKRRLKTAF